MGARSGRKEVKKDARPKANMMSSVTPCGAFRSVHRVVLFFFPLVSSFRFSGIPEGPNPPSSFVDPATLMPEEQEEEDRVCLDFPCAQNTISSYRSRPRKKGKRRGSFPPLLTRLALGTITRCWRYERTSLRGKKLEKESSFYRRCSQSLKREQRREIKVFSRR